MEESLHLNERSGISDLLAMEVGIGDALQLQDAGAPQHRYHVNLIGFVNKQGVLVAVPPENTVLLESVAGRAFLVRGFSGRKTYEFSTRLIQANLTPSPYLYLSFPAEVSFVTMRGALRIRPKLDCVIEFKSADQEASGRIEDISTSGARVAFKRSSGKLNDEVMLSFRLPIDGEMQLFVIPAAIRNIDGDAGTDSVEYGLQFLHAGGKARMALQNFIYKTMASS